MKNPFTQLRKSDSTLAIIIKLFIPIVLVFFVLYGAVNLFSWFRHSYAVHEVTVSGRVFQPIVSGSAPLKDVEVSIVNQGERIYTLTDELGEFNLKFASESDKPYTKRVVARYSQYETVGEEVLIDPKGGVVDSLVLHISPLRVSVEEKQNLLKTLKEVQSVLLKQSEEVKELTDSLIGENIPKSVLYELQDIIRQFDTNIQWLQDEGYLFNKDLVSLTRMQNMLEETTEKQNSLIASKDKLLLDLKNYSLNE